MRRDFLEEHIEHRRLAEGAGGSERTMDRSETARRNGPGQAKWSESRDMKPARAKPEPFCRWRRDERVVDPQRVDAVVETTAPVTVSRTLPRMTPGTAP